MALPALTVRVAFGSDPFDAAPSWTDITNDVQKVYIKRGRQNELNRMEAGTATIQLKNLQGNYWPLNVAGSYYPNVKPNKRINIRATYGGSTYDLFTGFARRWEPFWLSQVGGQAPHTKLRCVDLIKKLSRLDLNDGTGYNQELSGTRVGNVLDDLGWPAADRDIDAGQSNMIATGALADANAMSHLFEVQESELGIIYIAGDGDVQFEDRHHRLKSPHTVSQATFGDDIGEQFYHDLVPEYDDEYIYNDIRITRNGGTQQTASDATSQGDYGKQTFRKTGLLMTSDNEAYDQAEYLLKRYKEPALRARTLKILGERDPVNLWPKLCDYDISTRITLRRNEASLDTDYYIEGVVHDIDLQSRIWVTQWQLSDADEQVYWALGVAGFSELGQTTYLAY